MNFVDILIGVVLLILAVKGFAKGLIREVCSLLGLVVGSLAALIYYRPLAEALHDHIHLSHYLRAILSFGLIFLALGLLFFFLGHILTTLFKFMLLGGINRVGGALLGIIQGAVILSMVLPWIVVEAMPAGVRMPVVESFMARPFLDFGRAGLAWSRFGLQGAPDTPPGNAFRIQIPTERLRCLGVTESTADDS